MAYYSWDDVLTVGERISRQGILDEIEYSGLRDMCQMSDGWQRAYLFNTINQSGYSPATIQYLFSESTPGDYDTASTGEPILIWVNA